MKTLKELLPYYKNVDIVIAWGNNKLNWGKGGKHIVERYYPYLLNQKVNTVTVDWQGKRVLVVSI